MVSKTDAFKEVPVSDNLFQCVITKLTKSRNTSSLSVENPVQYNSKLGTGNYHVTSLSPGIQVGEFEWKGKEDILFPLSSLKGWLWIGLLFSGRCQMKPTGRCTFARLEPGRCGLLYANKALFFARGETKVHILLIAIQSQVLHQIFPQFTSHRDISSLISILKLAASQKKLSPILDTLTTQLETQKSDSLSHHLNRISLLYQWLSELFSYIENKTDPNLFKQANEKLMREIRAFLEKNLAGTHSLDSLSRKFGINEFKLKQEFKKCYGVPVFTYLRELRMKKAADLLHNSDLSILDIALEVGYSNPSHFSQSFKERFSLLPKDFRKSGRA